MLGLAAACALIAQVGPARLWGVLVHSGRVIPAIIVLDALWMSLEAMALLVFYGPVRRNIPARVWARSMIVHYATMAVLPVGRVGAEVARATLLSPYVGSHKVAAGAAQMQILVLLSNTVVCVPCYLAAGRLGGWTSALALLLLFNFAANGGLGVGLLLLSRNVRIGGWLGRRFEKMVSWGPELDVELRRGPVLPVASGLLCLAGRSAQALEYGLVLAVAGGAAFSLTGTLLSEGIHIAAAGFGDAVPNQVGVSEGMYRLFASELGLAAHPERALAIAIVIRAANFVAAGLCFLLIALWPKGGQEAPAVAPAVSAEPPQASGGSSP